MTENENENKATIEMTTLLNITRQKLVTATLLNTELEALVEELNNKISELENKS